MDRYIDLRPLEYLTKDLSGMGWFYVLWGMLLIGWGVTILVWPEFLTILVAALFFSIGILVLVLGWHILKTKRRFERFTKRLLP